MIFSAFLLCKWFIQILSQTSVNLVTLTCVSWSEGHQDLYFTVQWLCLISWRLFDIESVWHNLWPKTKCMSRWPIFHGPVFLPYISKTIWWMSVILSDETVWPNLWPEIHIGQHDLHFMVRWLCIISWRLLDGWKSNFWIMSQCNTTFDLIIKVTVTYISWISDFALRLEDYLMDECHTLRLWDIVTQPLSSK